MNRRGTKSYRSWLRAGRSSATRFGIVVGLLLLETHVAQADAASENEAPPAAHHPRIFLGGAFGEGFAKSSLRGDRVVPREGTEARVAFELGYSQPLSERFFSVLLLGRIGSLTTGWSQARDESRYAMDIGIGPELRFDVRPRRANVQWRFFVPVGFTHAWIEPGPGRAVAEAYAPANGWHLGAGTGLDLSGSHVGAYVDLSYVVHFVNFEHTATLNSSPTVVDRNEYGLVDQALFLSCGILYRP